MRVYTLAMLTGSDKALCQSYLKRFAACVSLGALFIFPVWVNQLIYSRAYTDEFIADVTFLVNANGLLGDVDWFYWIGTAVSWVLAFSSLVYLNVQVLYYENYGDLLRFLLIVVYGFAANLVTYLPPPTYFRQDHTVPLFDLAMGKGNLNVASRVAWVSYMFYATWTRRCRAHWSWAFILFPLALLVWIYLGATQQIYTVTMLHSLVAMAAFHLWVRNRELRRARDMEEKTELLSCANGPEPKERTFQLTGPSDEEDFDDDARPTASRQISTRTHEEEKREEALAEQRFEEKYDEI